MGKYEGVHEISVVGQCYTKSTSAASQSKTLVADPKSAGARTFLIAVTEATHIRMGPSSGFSVTTSDWRLPGGGIAKVTVTDARHNTLYFIQADKAGTIYVAELDNEAPGTSASGDSTDFDS